MGLTVENSNIIAKNMYYPEDNTCFYNDCEYNQDNSGITKEKLIKLADLSETIEEPYIVGDFNNEQHYLKTLELVLNSTMETRNRVLFFQNEIVPKIYIKESLLDIGPGDGSLTRILANYFRGITAIDPNQHILSKLQQLLPFNTNYLKINKNILDAEFEMGSYNLAVLSHILYYIEPTSWLKVVKSVYNSLEENGFLVIVLGGDELGKAELIKNFGGQTLIIDRLALDCRSEFGASNTSLYASNEAFIARSKKAMFHISAFMLADAKISANKDDLNQYIEEKLQHSESYFEITTRQKYIVIKKKG